VVGSCHHAAVAAAELRQPGRRGATTPWSEA